MLGQFSVTSNNCCESYRNPAKSEGTERLKTLLEVAAGIYSEIGESKEVLFNTRAYASLRLSENKT